MRCLSCDAEMRLIQADPHETIPTLEYKTFECSACSDIERRLTLSTNGGPDKLVAVAEAPPSVAELPPSVAEAPPSIAEAPPSAPSASANEEADQGLWRNAWAILKGQRSGS